MRSYRDLSIRWKAGVHLVLILLFFTFHLIAMLLVPQYLPNGILLQLIQFGTFGGGVILVLLLFITLDIHVIRPLDQLDTETQSIAQDHTDTSVTTIDRSDEVGTLSHSLAEMKAQMVSSIEDAQQFQQAVEHAGHSIYITDTDGTITYVNSAFEEITKYSEAEAIGENPRILKSGHHSTSYYEELWETILAGDVWEENEFVNKRATGELFLADQTIAPITDKNGEVTGFVSIMVERTEERVREQQAMVLSRVLRHNLRTELNLIDGYAYEILKAETTESQAENVRRIRESVEKMERVGEKAERTMREMQKKLYRESQSVCAAVERTYGKMEEQYPKAIITADLPEYEIDVLVNIESVLDELVENAIEHNDRDTPEVTIGVTIQEEDDKSPPPTVLITVDDNGPGIPEDERIVLEKGRETPLLHGSGIGLWFVHWAVTLAGGKITILKCSPSGTRVSLTIPRGSVSPFPRNSVADERSSSERQPDNNTNTATNE